MQSAPISPGAARPLYVIRATPNVFALEPAVLWEYRSLVWLLVLRDFRIKYRQSVFGACWLLLHPFGSVCLYSFIFGNLARMPSDNVPFAPFNYVGLLPWMFFSASLPAVTQCLLANSHLLQKVYFPRILLPVQALVSALVDFLILLVIQIGILCLFGYAPGGTSSGCPCLSAGRCSRAWQWGSAWPASTWALSRRRLRPELPDSALVLRHPDRVFDPSTSSVRAEDSLSSIR